MRLFRLIKVANKLDKDGFFYASDQAMKRLADLVTDIENLDTNSNSQNNRMLSFENFKDINKLLEQISLKFKKIMRLIVRISNGDITNRNYLMDSVDNILNAEDYIVQLQEYINKITIEIAKKTNLDNSSIEMDIGIYLDKCDELLEHVKYFIFAFTQNFGEFLRSNIRNAPMELTDEQIKNPYYDPLSEENTLFNETNILFNNINKDIEKVEIILDNFLYSYSDFKEKSPPESRIY